MAHSRSTFQAGDLIYAPTETNSLYLGKILGAGSYGQVFVGQDPKTEKFVAVKKFQAFNQQSFELPFYESLAAHKQDLQTKIDELKSQEASAGDKKELAELEDSLAKIKPEVYLEKYYKTRQNIRDNVMHEHKIATIVGEAIGPVQTQENEDGSITYQIVLKLIPGKTLSQLLKEEPALTSAEIFEIVNQLIDKLIELQDEKGVVLRDLHTNNIMYDVATAKVGIIDWGDALQLENGKANGQAMGSDPFMAPEVVQAADMRHAEIQRIEYSEVTTVYSLGAIMAKLFDLGTQCRTQNHKCMQGKNKVEMYMGIKLNPIDAPGSQIDDEESRAQMLDLLAELMMSEPDKRTITLSEVKQRFMYIMNHTIDQNNVSDDVYAAVTEQSAVPASPPFQPLAPLIAVPPVEFVTTATVSDHATKKLRI